MIGADRLGNENANRKVAQTNGIMVIDAEIRYNGTAETANDGRNIVREWVVLLLVMIVVCMIRSKKRTTIGVM